MEVLLENAQSLLQGDGWKLIVMWLIGAVLIYLAIAKDMEPSLLLPIGFDPDESAGRGPRDPASSV